MMMMRMVSDEMKRKKLCVAQHPPKALTSKVQKPH